MNKYQERIARVCAEMKKAGIGQLMVNDHLGIYYLTGIDVMPFERFWAFLINDDGSTVLFDNKLFALGDTGLNTVTLTDTDDVAARQDGRRQEHGRSLSAAHYERLQRYQYGAGLRLRG